MPYVAPEVIAAVDKGIKDITATVIKAAQDTHKTAEKAAEDTKAEAGRAGKFVEDAGKAVVHYVQREVASQGKVLTNAEKRIREGKVVDAFWHMGTERAQSTDDNAAAMAQESELIRTVGSVAASAYGGPGGAAAYAAWLTYKQTGDANLALRVGILTGASSAAFGAAGDMPSGTAYELAQKTVVTGAIGGLAVAAAGGNDEAIKAGFLSAGAMVLVQDGYKSYTKVALDGKAAEGEAYCMTPNQACSPPEDAMLKVDPATGDATLDMSKLDPKRPAVGMKVDPSKVSWMSEQSPGMTLASRVPGMQAMAIFHDTWTMGWDSGLLTKASIVPAVVLTYTGTGAPYYDLVRKTAIDSAVATKLKAEADPSGATPIPAPANPVPSTSTSALSQPLPLGNPAEAVALPGIARKANTSYMCAAGDQVRYILVFTDSQARDGSKCRVTYKRPEGSAELVSSRKNRSICDSKAENIVATSVDAGWSCFIGSADMQATRAKRIAKGKTL